MVKIPIPGNPDLSALYKSKKGTTVDSEEEYREFVRNNPPPDGYVWSRSPFTSGGKWKVSLARQADIKTHDTGLEQRLRDHLQNWGYWSHFEQNYALPDGKQIDFADTREQVALEPGAVYWHTPEGYDGQAKQHIAENPDMVYSPVTQRDARKHKMLKEEGWDVLWITSTGVDEHSEKIRQWLAQHYE